MKESLYAFILYTKRRTGRCYNRFYFNQWGSYEFWILSLLWRRISIDSIFKGEGNSNENHDPKNEKHNVGNDNVDDMNTLETEYRRVHNMD